MLLGRVVGTVVPCVVYDGLTGVPMLLVQPLDKNRQAAGGQIVCCDATRMAGPGELVYYEGGREAAMALDITFVPVDHAIIGIVDETAASEPNHPRPITSEPGHSRPITSEPGHSRPIASEPGRPRPRKEDNRCN